MRTQDFDFDLPRGLIAQEPLPDRDAARLLVVRQDGVEDSAIRQLPDLLKPGDLLVVNDTRVIPARLSGRRLRADGEEAKVQITLHRDRGEGTWAVFAKPGRKLRPGDRIAFDAGLEAEVLKKHPDGEIELRLNKQNADLMTALDRAGIMPLPPYIRRAAEGNPQDAKDYQTVFAAQPGAVAAPTAGLHFTSELLHRLGDAGIERVTVTLHVGAGTFLPVKAEKAEDHSMHSEWGRISEAAATQLNAARASGRRIVAVGTTALRLLESAAGDNGEIHPFEGETDIYILPGYRFKAVDALLTNFHLPCSTLFMLVCAFAGTERMKAAYAHAMDEGYRFYSYGDACLLEHADA